MGKHQNPRVQLTIPDDTYKIYKQFADISKRPLSKILTEILIESSPVYKDILIALESSNNDAETFKKEIKDRLLLKTSDALQQTLDI